MKNFSLELQILMCIPWRLGTQSHTISNAQGESLKVKGGNQRKDQLLHDQEAWNLALVLL